MRLTLANFFSHLIFNPFDAETKRQKAIAVIASIACGIFSLFICHVVCAIRNYTHKSPESINPQELKISQVSQTALFQENPIEPIKKKTEPKIDEQKPVIVEEQQKKIIAFYINKRARLLDLKDQLTEALSKKNEAFAQKLAKEIGKMEERDVTRAALRLYYDKAPARSEKAINGKINPKELADDLGISQNTLTGILFANAYAEEFLRNLPQIIEQIIASKSSQLSTIYSQPIELLKQISNQFKTRWDTLTDLTQIAGLLKKNKEETVNLIGELWEIALEDEENPPFEKFDISKFPRLPGLESLPGMPALLSLPEFSSPQQEKMPKLPDYQTCMAAMIFEETTESGLNQFERAIKLRTEVDYSSLSTIIANMSKYPESFCKPFLLIKWQNILNHLKESPDIKNNGLIAPVQTLMEKICENMPLKRQGALIKLLAKWEKMTDLCDIIFRCVYFNGKTHPELELNKGMIGAKLLYVIKRANDKLDQLNKASEENIKDFIPPSIWELFEYLHKTHGFAKAKETVIQKLNNITKRQKKRLKALKKGKNFVIIPQYFHACPDQEVAVSIAKTGIESLTAVAGHGAFFSTTPELRYGPVIFGLPKTVEFKPMISYNNNPSSKWISLEHLIRIHPQKLRKQEHFEKSIRAALTLAFNQCKDIPVAKKMELEELFCSLFKRSVVFRPSSFEKDPQLYLYYRKLSLERTFAGNKIMPGDRAPVIINNREKLKQWFEHIQNFFPDEIKQEMQTNKQYFSFETFSENFENLFGFEKDKYPNPKTLLDPNISMQPKNEQEKLNACIIAPDDEFEDFYKEELSSKKCITLSRLKEEFKKHGMDQTAEFIPLSEQEIEKDFFNEIDSRKHPKSW